MQMDSLTIRKFQPGSFLDGHVHDVLGFPEPVWPYSTHPNAAGRLREWLKSHNVKLWMPGTDGYPGDDCVVQFQTYPRQSFEAVSASHALCLAVLLANYLDNFGIHHPIGSDRGARRLP
jgi:hypothetical protein